ncbi:MAG: type II toxin-antitoxin system RelE/ParE family toxin [Candidatus Tectomicrobia bacterium]|nr:type II toxin-antitoxin system RelE/ParE family toxin [Candidatus Tectomicrobia bacterium]
MSRNTREIAWVRAARKEFETFPPTVQRRMQLALTIAAEGRKTDIAKPMRGLGSGVFEVALAQRGNAYRAVYAVQIGEAVWVVHAFQKKSTRGIKTPKKEIDLIQDRIKRLREQLQDE